MDAAVRLALGAEDERTRNEAAAWLFAHPREREEMICHLLSRREEIDEVILYEAADWLYFMPLSDPDLCGHGFVDRCFGKGVRNQ